MSSATIEKTSVASPALAARSQKLRVAVIGCGAVTRQFHLPVLAGHESVRLVALIDRDLARAKGLAEEYRVPCAAEDASELEPDAFDAAVVATPPAFHAECAIKLLESGSHVLVEKPMATSYPDAVAMVEAADRAGKVLSVGLFRRLLPGLKLMKAAIDGALLGPVKRFSLEGGAVYGWPAATLGNMRKDFAGGGVLMDMGPHYLDQLLFLFDGPAELTAYEDDSLGGIEADCRLELRVQHAGGSIKGHLELSRIRNLENSLRVDCERGTLELLPGERYRVRVTPHDVHLLDPATGKARDVQLDAMWSDEGETPWHETIRSQIDDWLDAIQSNGTPQLSGRSALASMAIIDECYRRPQRRRQTWVDHPLCSGEKQFAAVVNGASVNGHTRRVLVTGASGFIGCRVAEILSRRAGYRVLAMVHDPAHASRVARLDADLIQVDLTNPGDIRRAVEGCDSVVHCAIGTSYGNRREIFRVTAGGTKNLVEAAIAAKVSRLIHVSTIAVYGEDVSGILDESTPLRPGRDDYSASKYEAERLVLAAAGRGLCPIVLRPGCVYGPYGATFTTRPIEHLLRGALVLRGSANTPSNTVYVDNLVEAIVRSLEADDRLAGQAFTIADDDGMTWGDFYAYFADALGAQLRTAEAGDETSAPRRNPWLVAAGEIARSAELKELAKKLLYTDPIGRFPRRMLEASPRLKQWLRRRLRMDQPAVYSRCATDRAATLDILPRPAEVKSTLARQRLGYQPMISRTEALSKTLEWLRFSRIS